MSSFFFALMGVTVKWLALRIPAEEVALVRTVLPALFLTPAMVMEFRRGGRAMWREAPLLALRGLFGGIALVLYFRAIALIDLSNAALLCYTSPLFTAILAAVFLNEPLTRRVLLAMPVVFAGVILVLRPSVLFGGHMPESLLVGSVYGLISGVSAAAAYTSVRKLVGRCSNTTIVGAFGWVGTFICLPLVARSYVAPQPIEWAGLALVALFATIAQLFMTAGYRRYPAVLASTLGLSTVVFAALLGWAFLHEVIVPLEALGLVVTLGGLVFMSGPESSAAEADLEGDPESRVPGPC